MILILCSICDVQKKHFTRQVFYIHLYTNTFEETPIFLFCFVATGLKYPSLASVSSLKADRYRAAVVLDVS